MSRQQKFLIFSKKSIGLLSSSSSSSSSSATATAAAVVVVSKSNTSRTGTQTYFSTTTTSSSSSNTKKQKPNLESILKNASNSSSSSDNTNSSSSSSSSSSFSHKQPFVTHRLHPGQPNPLTQIYKRRSIRSDPLYRPPWRHSTKANIISASDFNARPRVTFEEQFDSLHDGMITLSWLTEKQRQDIYTTYLTMIESQNKNYSITSHEYVMKLIGQQYNLSTDRISAIVQQCHDEEQMMKTNPELVHDKLSHYIDAMYKEHIDNVYNAYGEVNPNEFIEDPVEVGGNTVGDSDGGTHVSVGDLYDVDELITQSILREKDEAQMEIDRWIYKEDQYDRDIETKVNKECLALMKQKNDIVEDLNNSFKMKQLIDDDDGGSGKNYGNTNTVKEGERRKRWKYVAQIINVRDEKKREKLHLNSFGKKKKKKTKKNMYGVNKVTNTIVEEDGMLRVATLDELNDVSWKDVRDEKEFMFRGVKKAWLDRKSGKAKEGWGRVPEEIKAAARARLEEEQAKLTKQDGDEEGGEGKGNDE